MPADWSCTSWSRGPSWGCELRSSSRAPDAKSRRRDVAVVVVTAQSAPAITPYPPAATDALARLAEEHQERLRHIVDEMATAQGVPAEVRRLRGHPVDAILGVAGDDSLVVAGSRGHRGLARLFLGSVSLGRLQRAAAAVVVRVSRDPDEVQES